MYSREEKERAIQAYFQNGNNATKTARELGYPTAPALIKWVNQYNPPAIKKTAIPRRRYTEEEIQRAIDYYFENGCNVKKTVRELGYGSENGLLQWLRKRVPDKVSKYGERGYRPAHSKETRESALLDLVSGKYTAKEICEKYGISDAILYDWKLQYMGRGSTEMKPSKTTSNTEDLTKEIAELKRQKELLEKELEVAKKELYRAHLEKDIYETAAEVLKKELGIDYKNLKNREKAMVIDALRYKYPLKSLLEVLNMAKSSYCYQEIQLKKEDPLAEIRIRIIVLFKEAKERYGYRRIHQLLRNEGRTISEKIVRKIMNEEHLIVRNIKKKKYSSYMGEISPAVENKIKRDFHAEKPNEKWLTDITEFHIEAGKIYLSPLIDCFDGLPITWTVGTSPNAELVNTMLDNGIALLCEDEHPIVHSDRGGHYRWPGWIERMDKAGLIRSMSKKGCSPDNSACEGFFGRMKNEMFYERDWRGVSVETFIEAINEYMEWYREERIKMSLGGVSPMEYRRRLGLI